MVRITIAEAVHIDVRIHGESIITEFSAGEHDVRPEVAELLQSLGHGQVIGQPAATSGQSATSTGHQPAEKRLTKKELLALAAERGIEVPPKANVAVITSLLDSAEIAALAGDESFGDELAEEQSDTDGTENTEE